MLALLFNEAGADSVSEILAEAPSMSTVNWAEVLSKLKERAVSAKWADAGLREAGILDALSLVPFSRAHAALAADLRPLTRALGLSLGDRCCLALAKAKQACAVTADRAWGAIEEIDVRVIR